jgi:hypothetical protein
MRTTVRVIHLVVPCEDRGALGHRILHVVGERNAGQPGRRSGLGPLTRVLLALRQPYPQRQGKTASRLLMPAAENPKPSQRIDQAKRKASILVTDSHIQRCPEVGGLALQDP